MMDADKDGVIGKSDLRQTFDALGKMVSDKELDELLGEATVSSQFYLCILIHVVRFISCERPTNNKFHPFFKFFKNF